MQPSEPAIQDQAPLPGAPKLPYRAAATRAWLWSDKRRPPCRCLLICHRAESRVLRRVGRLVDWVVGAY